MDAIVEDWKLEKANLSQANLTRANLVNANLRGALLTGAGASNMPRAALSASSRLFSWGRSVSITP